MSIKHYCTPINFNTSCVSVDDIEKVKTKCNCINEFPCIYSLYNASLNTDNCTDTNITQHFDNCENIQFCVQGGFTDYLNMKQEKTMLGILSSMRSDINCEIKETTEKPFNTTNIVYPLLSRNSNVKALAKNNNITTQESDKQESTSSKGINSISDLKETTSTVTVTRPTTVTVIEPTTITMTKPVTVTMTKIITPSKVSTNTVEKISTDYKITESTDTIKSASSMYNKLSSTKSLSNSKYVTKNKFGDYSEIYNISHFIPNGSNVYTTDLDKTSNIGAVTESSKYIYGNISAYTNTSNYKYHSKLPKSAVSNTPMNIATSNKIPYNTESNSINNQVPNEYTKSIIGDKSEFIKYTYGLNNTYNPMVSRIIASSLDKSQKEVKSDISSSSPDSKPIDNTISSTNTRYTYGITNTQPISLKPSASSNTIKRDTTISTPSSAFIKQSPSLNQKYSKIIESDVDTQTYNSKNTKAYISTAASNTLQSSNIIETTHEKEIDRNNRVNNSNYSESSGLSWYHLFYLGFLVIPFSVCLFAFRRYNRNYNTDNTTENSQNVKHFEIAETKL